MEFLTFSSTSCSSASCLPPSSADRDSNAAAFLHLLQYSHHHHLNPPFNSSHTSFIATSSPFLIHPDPPPHSIRAPPDTTTITDPTLDDIDPKQTSSSSTTCSSSTIDHPQMPPHHPPPPPLLLNPLVIPTDPSADPHPTISIDDLHPLDHPADHAGCRSSASSISSSSSAAAAAAIQTIDACSHVTPGSCAATICEMNRAAVNSSATASTHCAINSCEAAMPYDYDYNAVLQGGRPAVAVSSPRNGGSAGNGRMVGKSRSMMMDCSTGEVAVDVVMMQEEDNTMMEIRNNKRRKKRKRGGGGADGNAVGSAAASAASLQQQHSATAAKNSKKNREELEHQRMTHIAVERNRRRQMNIHLAALRSIMPSSYVQRGDQASIVGGAIRFVEELEQLVQCLHLQKQLRAQSNNVDHTNTSTTNSGRLMAIPDDHHHYEHFQMVDTSTVSQLLHFPNINHGNCNTTQLDMDDTSAFHLREGSYAASSSPIASIEVNIISPSTIFLKVLAPKKPHQLLHTISALTTLYLKVMQLNVTAMDANTILFSFNLQMDADYQLQTPNELVEVIQNILGAHDDGRCEHIITF